MGNGGKKKKPNQFVSLIPNIRSTGDISRKLGEALNYQFMFRKSTTPWERAELDPTSFILEPEDVDRVYHLRTIDNDERAFEFIGRTKGSHYVDLVASCDYTGFECHGKGRIFISRNPWLFFNSIDHRHNNINERLRVDGTPVEILPRYDKFGAPYPTAPKIIRDAINAYDEMKVDYNTDTDTDTDND